MEELKIMAGFYKNFTFIYNSKKTYGQMLANTVDPYQAEYNTLNVLYNLDHISESKANKYVQDIPAYARQAIPA